MMGCIGSRLRHFTIPNFNHGRNHSSSSSPGGGGGGGGDRVHHHSNSISNHESSSDGLGNIFPVLNVDDVGRHISPGKLEVTETDLILYIPYKLPLTWPLRCLRRYGYENELFSFESGRRCPTGPGIYAFKCTRAQSLFNLLQSKIQNNPCSTITLPPPQQQQQQQPACPPPCPSSSSPNPVSPPPDGLMTGVDDSASTTPGSISPTFDYVNIAENQLQLQLQLQLRAGEADNNASATATASSDNTTTPAAITTSIAPTSSELDSDNTHPVYMNVESQQKGTKRSKISSKGKVGTDLCNGTPAFSSLYQNDYLNYNSAAAASKSTENNNGSRNNYDVHSCAVLYTNVACPPQPKSGHHRTTSPPAQKLYTTTNTPPPPITEINYAELDLKQIPCSKSSSLSLSLLSSSNANSSSSTQCCKPSLSGSSTTCGISQPDSVVGRKSDNLRESSSNSRLGKSKLKVSKSEVLYKLISPTTASSSSQNPSSISYAIIQPAQYNNNNNNNHVPVSQTMSSTISSNSIHQQQQQQQQQSPSELGYATIDFDRTAALSIVKRSKIKLNFPHSSSTDKDEDDEQHHGPVQLPTTTTTTTANTTATRKTRHNSTAL